MPDTHLQNIQGTYFPQFPEGIQTYYLQKRNWVIDE